MNKRNNLLQSEIVKPTTLKTFVKNIIESIEDFESGRIDSVLFVKKTINSITDLSESQEI
jgi:hypothetical protein